MKNPIHVCKTILIVEDDADIRDTIQDALELEGYTVLTAANGKIGLDLLREVEKPCLVLLDLMMPVMGGREFLDNLLDDVILAPIPVFILSAAADKQNTIGAAGFIKKPADLSVLLKMVKEYCHNEA